MSFNDEDTDFERKLKEDFNVLRQDYQKAGLTINLQPETQVNKKATPPAKTQKKKKKLLWPVAGLGAAAALVFALIQYSPAGEQAGASQVEARITFKRGKVSINTLPARPGQKIKSQDSIAVGAKSSAVIQFGKDALVTLSAETRIQVDELIKKQKLNVVLSQQAGSTFSKIRPGRAEYQVKTPTAVAGVRGTSFQLSLNKQKHATIKLIEGRVAVRKASSQEKDAVTLNLKAGQKVTVDKSAGQPRAKKLKRKEKERLQGLNQVKLVNQFATLEQSNTGGAVLPESTVALLEEAGAEKVTSSKQKPAKKLTLADLRQKYGKLTRLVTTGNRVYVGGNWRQVGDFHYLQTIHGPKKIKTSEVSRVLPLD